MYPTDLIQNKPCHQGITTWYTQYKGAQSFLTQSQFSRLNELKQLALTMSELLTYLQTNLPQFRKSVLTSVFSHNFNVNTSIFILTNPRNRLAALYSDFRHLKTTNPDGYAANIEAWRSGLSAAARAGVTPSRDLVSVNIDEEFLRGLQSKEWGRPISLGTVVREAEAKKEVMLFQEFMASEGSIYARRWGISIPGPLDVLKWGLRTVGVLGEEQDKILVGRVVLLENLELAGKEVAMRGGGLKGGGGQGFYEGGVWRGFC